MRAVRLVEILGGAIRITGIVGLMAALALSQACGSKTEEERLAEARKALDERNVIGAELMLKEFLEKFPDSPKATLARFELSQAYFMDKDYEKCRELLDEIITISGGLDTESGLNAASLKLDTYLAENHIDIALDEAVKTSNSLHTVSPQYRQLLNLKTAELFKRNNRHDESITIAEALLKEKAPSPALHFDAMRILSDNLMKLNRIDDLIKTHLDYIEANPTSELNSFLKLEVAQVLEQNGRSAEAAPYFDAVEALLQEKMDSTVGADSKISLAIQLSQIKEARRKNEEAQEILRKVIEEYPMSAQRPNAMRSLAESYFRSGRKAEGHGLLDQIISTYPNTPYSVQATGRKRELAAVEAKSGDAPTTGSMPAAPADAPTTGAATTEPPSPAPAQ